MQQITLRVSESTKESLKGEAEDREQTLSDYMRDLIAQRNEDTITQDEYDRLRDEHGRLQDEHERLQSEHERLRTEVERVRREKRQILDLTDEHESLVKYAEDERTHADKVRRASLPQRVKWFLFGDKE